MYKVLFDGITYNIPMKDWLTCSQNLAILSELTHKDMSMAKLSSIGGTHYSDSKLVPNLRLKVEV